MTRSSGAFANTASSVRRSLAATAASAARQGPPAPAANRSRCASSSASARAIMVRMSRNAALDTVRARHTISVAEIFGTNVTTGGEDAPERARSLHAAFATLPEDQRQVVVLRHVLGLSPVEIAEQLGRTSSSV